MSIERQKQWYRRNLDLAGQVVVDVGTNVGELSQLFFDHVGKKGRVISVEPHPANIKALEKRIRKAGSSRWTLKRCAVSSQQGKLALRTLKTNDGHNAVVANAGGGDLEVPCMPLTLLAPEATRVKLDVEGHEYVILPDAVPALDRVRGWAVELHMVAGHPLEDTLKLFADHGFSLATAGQRRGDPSEWLSVVIEPTLTWEDVPGVPSRRDGVPRVFKMLHLLARR